ncbi:Coq4 family protein [Nostoc sp. 'Lobaria pulmonaria (5183) cyanobiont']|uniref:Coq4 family protein n=1 Tax=Nostoc sp. 'Lobaria pulmonaria (5183) cyanobiont' TaxID=1618022 RepID=UPI000CF33F8A|nr:Coq4 family protein [Nostoc sp. 'Lobaria pulmonaria (5183) cyanobiont']AVH70295.1 coenzyme Q (ubiquinone) biosynthesis protein Coq4 [Nostoc sp. 'Lobaria pulmonaria (5183) cyanobiont']
MLLAEQRRISHDFKTILKSMVCLFREPTNLEYIYNLEDELRSTQASLLAVEWLKTQPEVSLLIQERYIAPYPNIEVLLQYPEDSLGYAYASYIKKYGFDPSFYRQMQVEDDVSYVLLRSRQTHDIWHVVTGFKTDGLGELGLKAFELSQTRRNLAVFLVGGGLLSILVKSPDVLPDLLEKIAVGYTMGLKAKPLLAQKWEEHWEKPLLEWRTELGIDSDILN